MDSRMIAMAETRRRIVDAAIALYQERGIAETSMKEIARRADVAAATVLNHFATPDAVAEEVVSVLWRRLRFPSEQQILAVDTVPDRVAVLIHEMVDFYDRSETWYRIHELARGKSPAFAAGEARFFEYLTHLIRLALGPLAEDEETLAATMLFVSPAAAGNLRAMGLPSARAAQLLSRLGRAWYVEKVAQSEEVRS
jgi:AcrR family transcriptional regulator